MNPNKENTKQLQDYLNLKKEFNIQKEAIGSNNSKKLLELGLNRKFNSNDLTKTYLELQKKRKDLNLGIGEELKLIFPFIGQKIRGNFNQMFNLKAGGKIEIKPENKGKFTEYCGGKVTQECITKGKNSPNPTIVKRATFADNTRK